MEEAGCSKDCRAVTVPNFPLATGGDGNFEFAFNSSTFSDRVLRIEVMGDPEEFKSEGEWALHRKRWREEATNDKGVSVELTLVNSNQLDAADCLTYKNQDGEAVEMIEEPSSGADQEGDKPSESNGASSSANCSNILRVESVYVSSAILAAKSKFFYKLFSNGMQESEQRYAALRISAAEEAALMALLRFMYSGKLLSTFPPFLLDVLMIADKFEVPTCMSYCTQLAMALPMTIESALCCLDRPPTILEASAVQPLVNAAKEFLANKYKKITMFEDEVLTLPLVAIEAIFCRNDLEVTSEDAVYDLLVKWAHTQYPNLEERHEMFNHRLVRLIRFPHISCWKLHNLLVSSSDLYSEIAYKLIAEALFFKVDKQRFLGLDKASSWRFAERAYKHKPFKIVELDTPNPQCIIYLDLKKEELAKLFPSGRIFSQAFPLGGQVFFLSVECNMDSPNMAHCCGIFLWIRKKKGENSFVTYEFAARTRVSENFARITKASCCFTGQRYVGFRNFFKLPWNLFMAADSPYFINEVLHLRAEVSIKQPPQH